ncbi:MAG: stalk domain-containing protein, partial [Paenibacillaceae bacterium]
SSLLIIHLFSPAAVFATYYQEKEVLLKLNGAYLIYSSSSMPYIDEHSRTLVPLRIISDALNGTIHWNNQEKEVGMKSATLQITAKLNSPNISVNGHEVKVDTSFKVKNGTVMVPIKWIAEGLGASWSYDPQYLLVSLDHDAFFQQGKLELMSDEENVDRTVDVHIIPRKISYKYDEGYNYDKLNLTIINASDQTFSKRQIQDHLFAPIDKENYVNMGSKGSAIGDSSEINLIDSIGPNEEITYEMHIGRLDNGLLQPGWSTQYAFIRYFKLLEYVGSAD